MSLRGQGLRDIRAAWCRRDAVDPLQGSRRPRGHRPRRVSGGRAAAVRSSLRSPPARPAATWTLRRPGPGTVATRLRGRSSTLPPAEGANAGRGHCHGHAVPRSAPGRDGTWQVGSAERPVDLITPVVARRERQPYYDESPYGPSSKGHAPWPTAYRAAVKRNGAAERDLDLLSDGPCLALVPRTDVTVAPGHLRVPCPTRSWPLTCHFALEVLGEQPR